METNNLRVVKCVYSFSQTLSDLKSELKKREMIVFAEFDHRQNAADVGLEMPQSTVLVFGAPKTGTQLLLENPAIALELPLKIAVWEDDQKQVWMHYKNPTVMAEAYGLAKHSVILAMQELLTDIVHEVTSPAENELREGTEVYFLVSGYVLKGKVIDLHNTKNSYTFSIEGYGGCGGNHILSGDQLHRRIFLSEDEANQFIDIEQMYLEGHC